MCILHFWNVSSLLSFWMKTRVTHSEQIFVMYTRRRSIC